MGRHYYRRGIIGEENKMSMTYDEAKNAVLFQYHKSIQFWYCILGEIYERTNGFNIPAKIKRWMNGITCIISCDAQDNWCITEV